MTYVFKCGNLYFKAFHRIDFEMHKSFEVVSSISDAMVFDDEALNQDKVSPYSDDSVKEYLEDNGFKLVRIVEDSNG